MPLICGLNSLHGVSEHCPGLPNDLGNTVLLVNNSVCKQMKGHSITCHSLLD